MSETTEWALAAPLAAHDQLRLVAPAGLIFVSPTMEPAVLNHDTLTGRRVLVIHGDADRHVSLKCVEAGIAALRTAGADVTVERNPEGTHFLLFAEAREVLRRVAAWAK